jgi:hypothetical protein
MTIPASSRIGFGMMKIALPMKRAKGLKSYAEGGAREPIVLATACSGEAGKSIEISPRVSAVSLLEAFCSNSAGSPPALPQAGEVGAGDCFTTRLEALDSSISMRKGCRSSVAETMGNSKARRQHNRTMERERENRPAARADVRSCRQINTAGSASISQSKLRSSSIER